MLKQSTPSCFFSGIRNSIEKRSDGSILAADAVSVLPFNNDLYVTKITGKTLLAALEHSATMFERDSSGGFLQMSGVHTTYDYNKPAGSRVNSTEVRCAACSVPTYEPLDESKLYSVIVPVFLLEGGDGHSFKENNGIEPQRMALNDAEAFQEYLKKRDFVYPQVEERITIIEKTEGGGGAGGDGAFSLASSAFLVCMASLLSLRLTN